MEARAIHHRRSPRPEGAGLSEARVRLPGRPPVTVIQRVFGVLAVVLASVTVRGLLCRRLEHVSHFFPAYLLLVAIGDLLVLADPQRFHTWTFWMVKESTVGLLKLGLALEIARLSFHALGGARRTALTLATCVLTTTCVAMLSIGP